jgi:death on curing protein
MGRWPAQRGPVATHGEAWGDGRLSPLQRKVSWVVQETGQIDGRARLFDRGWGHRDPPSPHKRNTAARTVCSIRELWKLRFSVPQTGYYNDISEEAAALLESLVNNHAFLDGNKRVEFATMHTFLLMNGFDLDVGSKTAYEFMVNAMEQGKFRFALIHEWMAEHFVPRPG